MPLSVYPIAAAAFFVIVVVLIVFQLCRSAAVGDEQLEADEQIQWPEFAVERREATEDELKAFSGAAVEAYRSKVARIAVRN